MIIILNHRRGCVFGYTPDIFSANANCLQLGYCYHLLFPTRFIDRIRRVYGNMPLTSINYLKSIRRECGFQREFNLYLIAYLHDNEWFYHLQVDRPCYDFDYYNINFGDAASCFKYLEHHINSVNVGDYLFTNIDEFNQQIIYNSSVINSEQREYYCQMIHRAHATHYYYRRDIVNFNRVKRFINSGGTGILLSYKQFYEYQKYTYNIYNVTNMVDYYTCRETVIDSLIMFYAHCVHSVNYFDYMRLRHHQSIDVSYKHVFDWARHVDNNGGIDYTFINDAFITQFISDTDFELYFQHKFRVHADKYQLFLQQKSNYTMWNR